LAGLPDAFSVWEVPHSPVFHFWSVQQGKDTLNEIFSMTQQVGFDT